MSQQVPQGDQLGQKGPRQHQQQVGGERNDTPRHQQQQSVEQEKQDGYDSVTDEGTKRKSDDQERISDRPSDSDRI